MNISSTTMVKLRVEFIMKKNGEFKKVIGLFGGISLVAGMTIGSVEVSFLFWEACVLQSSGHPVQWPVE